VVSEDREETSRIEAFSDGVFAIAITLLVLTLQVPDVHGGLWHALLDEWPQFAGYLTSFAIIGIMWVNHHSMFRMIVRSDRILLFLNLLLLLWTALLPFPTNLIARYLGDGGADAAVAEADGLGENGLGRRPAATRDASAPAEKKRDTHAAFAADARDRLMRLVKRPVGGEVAAVLVAV